MATKENEKNSEHTDEPKSAHATPVVEKYIKKRVEKAEKQIEKEEDDTTNTPSANLSNNGTAGSYYFVL